ncbi:MAG TPA: chemotaxis protein MotB [Kiloniellaceae bacterium]|nr:chemotaxis protein MotB [Kiloniellaceae bacterium]
MTPLLTLRPPLQSKAADIMARQNTKTNGKGQARKGLTFAVPVYQGRPDDGGQAWLLTFTDLTALLLTFFVLLYSMSTINSDDWQNLVDALSPKLPSVQEVTVALPSQDKDAEAIDRTPGTDLSYLASLLEDQVTEDPVLARADIRREGERIVFAPPGDLLFASGSIELSDQGKAAIFALSGVLRNLRNVIEIAGYADPLRPRRNFASNWELSLARATTLSDMITTAGYKGEILVRGYGHARYEAPAQACDEPARMAEARRVEIIIHAYAAERR